MFGPMARYFAEQEYYFRFHYLHNRSFDARNLFFRLKVIRYLMGFKRCIRVPLRYSVIRDFVIPES